MNIAQKIEELLKTQPDPRSYSGRLEFQARMFNALFTPFYGIVTDNKDPECLGRLRVSLDMTAPGSISPWYQTLNMWKSGDGHGLWSLPEIGTQVLVCIPNENFNQGVVLGCIYDEKHRPPEASSGKAGDSILWQTKKHRFEIIDEDIGSGPSGQKQSGGLFLASLREAVLRRPKEFTLKLQRDKSAA